MPVLEPQIGVCQWFHHGDRATVERALRHLRVLGIDRLRTGISWADWHRPDGPAWYDELFAALDGLDLLVSVWHTPPSLSEDGRCNAPPRRLQDYADFIDVVIDRYGSRIACLELWNEPNNRWKWDFAAHDPQWAKFAAMIGMAGHWARQRGMPTALGGMIPVDADWLRLIDRHGAPACVDIVACHAFPGMWWPGEGNWDWHERWRGWEDKLAQARAGAAGKPVWVTETGLATWDLATGRPGKFDLQARMLLDAAQAPAQRLYWYSLIDLDPARPAIEGWHVDENEYHLGLVDATGRRKEAWFAMQDIVRAAQRRAAG